MATLATARSFLFAPGSDAAKLRKALASSADAVIADFEDAVLPAEKALAREVTAGVYAAPPTGTAPLRLVRVNAPGTPWHEDDVAALEELALGGIVLPKATPDNAAAVDAAGLPVVATVETPDGLRRAFETASAGPVAAVMLGAVDLGLALGLEPRPDGQELLFARSSLVLASAAAGIRAPIDQVWTDFRDAEGLRRDCALARSLGFRGKACIHPGQLEVVNEAFAPSAGELERARAVVEAFEHAGAGAVALDGEMIDLPVVERARQVLAEATRGAPHAE